MTVSIMASLNSRCNLLCIVVGVVAASNLSLFISQRGLTAPRVMLPPEEVGRFLRAARHRSGSSVDDDDIQPTLQHPRS